MAVRNGHARAFAALARSYGIQLSYTDFQHRRVATSVESLLATLRSLGAEIRSPDDAPDALRGRVAARSAEALPPVTVVWQGDPEPSVALNSAAFGRRRPATALLELEDGAQIVTIVGTASRADRIALPVDLPLGYHRLRFGSAAASAEALVIVAPRVACQPDGERPGRRWGIFLPIYALSTSGTRGVADYSDLAAVVDWASERGAGTFGTLPLLPAFLDDPFDPSPYAPVSRLFWNELYVDPRATPEFGRSPEARRAFEAASSRGPGPDPGPLIDYRRSWEERRAAFRELARCGAQDTRMSKRTADFLRSNPSVRRYAAFRAASERLRAPWPSWPSAQRAGHLAPADFDPNVAHMYEFLQRAASEQLSAVAARRASGGAGLFLDLPVGVGAGSFDTWAFPHLFAMGASAGSPPDAFSARGQDWGFPPLNPDRIRTDRYEYWRAVLRHHMRHASMLRLDHVMGLHRMYFVPRGMQATEGAYVRFPTEEMYAVLTLESHRSGTQIVGEDLGMVPRSVGPAMSRHGLRRMYATYFEIDPGRVPPVHRPIREMAAFVNTHDMPTFGSFWSGADIELRRRLGFQGEATMREELRSRGRVRAAITSFLRRQGLLGKGGRAREVLRALLLSLASSPAGYMQINVEDLWLERSAQNVPGTTDEHTNWRRRARFRLEEWSRVPGLVRLLEQIARARAS